MKSNRSEAATPPTAEAHARQRTASAFARSNNATPADPWQEFLSARARVIEWLVQEYNWTDAQIARQLSLGAGQVQRMRPAGAGDIRSGASDTDVTMAAPLDN